MRKYSGLFSLLILLATFIVFYTTSFLIVLIIGFLAAGFASWYSPSGFWRKASATILIIIPVGYLVVFVLFLIGVVTSDGF